MADLNDLLGPCVKITAGPVRRRPRKFRAFGRVLRNELPKVGTIGTLRIGMGRHEGVRIVKVTTFDPADSTVGVIVEMEQP